MIFSFAFRFKMLKNTNRATFGTAVGHSFFVFFYYLIYILFVSVRGIVIFSGR